MRTNTHQAVSLYSAHSTISQGLRPPELAIIHAVEQSRDLVFDENTYMM
jgi:hypothetical protein